MSRRHREHPAHEQLALAASRCAAHHRVRAIRDQVDRERSAGSPRERALQRTVIGCSQRDRQRREVPHGRNSFCLNDNSPSLGRGRQKLGPGHGLLVRHEFHVNRERRIGARISQQLSGAPATDPKHDTTLAGKKLLIVRHGDDRALADGLPPNVRARGAVWRDGCVGVRELTQPPQPRIVRHAQRGDRGRERMGQLQQNAARHCRGQGRRTAHADSQPSIDNHGRASQNACVLAELCELGIHLIFARPRGDGRALEAKRACHRSEAEGDGKAVARIRTPALGITDRCGEDIARSGSRPLQLRSLPGMPLIDQGSGCRKLPPKLPELPACSAAALDFRVGQAGDRDNRSEEGEYESERRFRHDPDQHGAEHRRYARHKWEAVRSGGLGARWRGEGWRGGGCGAWHAKETITSTTDAERSRRDAGRVDGDACGRGEVESTFPRCSAPLRGRWLSAVVLAHDGAS